MIHDEYIRQWHHLAAPWSRWSLVEQDLIICRAVIAIFSDEFLRNELAWRGGTALHKLYLKPQARYSEDIDLVQINPGPIKPIVERLDAALSWLPNKSFDLRRFGFRQRFRFDSEIPPVEPMRLKIETNTYEHFSVLGYAHLPFAVDNPWFSGSCNVTTFRLDELLATKFRALYQRKKLRDLFDMDYAIRHADIAPDEILACWQNTWRSRTASFHRKRKSSPTSKPSSPIPTTSTTCRAFSDPAQSSTPVPPTTESARHSSPFHPRDRPLEYLTIS